MRGTLLGEEISSRNCNKGTLLSAKQEAKTRTYESSVLNMLVSDKVLLQVIHVVFFENLCTLNCVSVLALQGSLN